MKVVRDLKVSEYIQGIRVYNLLVLKSGLYTLVLEKNLRNLEVLSKEGKKKIRYSDIDTIFSTYEGKQCRESLEILQQFYNGLIKIDNGICVFIDGSMRAYEDVIDMFRNCEKF